MPEFDLKNLTFWRLGYLTIDVIVEENIFKKNKKKEKDISGMYCADENKIYIHPDATKSPEIFLETLFHELQHARRCSSGVDEMLILKEKLKGQHLLDIEELETQLDTVRLLDMLSGNIANFQYIINYFKQKEQKNGK